MERDPHRAEPGPGEQEGDHPELDRAYEEDEGGQVPDGQSQEGYEGPDPEDDPAGRGDEEDQGI